MIYRLNCRIVILFWTLNHWQLIFSIFFGTYVSYFEILHKAVKKYLLSYWLTDLQTDKVIFKGFPLITGERHIAGKMFLVYVVILLLPLLFIFRKYFANRRLPAVDLPPPLVSTLNGKVGRRYNVADPNTLCDWSGIRKYLATRRLPTIDLPPPLVSTTNGKVGRRYNVADPNTLCDWSGIRKYLANRWLPAVDLPPPLL